MAPSPENDSSPKAPDKEKPAENKDIVSDLNDRELKALLDEAITYKNPKDREGKSELFKGLLSEAEESERIARAASAGGSELVRHCNPSARRQGRHGRRKPSSISENVMHGGSLDNLAKEELFESATHHLHSISRKPVRVSARQREGGSLPCNVNSRETPSRDYQFLEEAKKNRAMKDKEYTAIDMETENLLDNDYLAQNFQQHVPPIELVQAGQIPKFTSKAQIQICGANVDDPIPLDLDGPGDSKKTYDRDALQNKVVHSKYQVFIPTYNTKRESDDKKVDENGNALNQKPKKKKIQTDKNVVVLKAESVEGHRSEIINDLPKLLEYIEGSKTKNPNVHGNKSKQLHKQHTSEDGVRNNKKQRAQSSKGKEDMTELKKSNSLGEISTAKLDEFAFSAPMDEITKEEKVIMRNKQIQNDRPRERRSWGNVEPPPFQTLYTSAPSVENLETLDNWVVTKPKKKCKKRRNSVSSGRSNRQNFNQLDNATRHHSTRAASPDLRGKSACSMPHSEKSNDSSSDVDSVHSLPIDGPISYAAIARNSDKKERKPSEKPVSATPRDKSVPVTVTAIVTSHQNKTAASHDTVVGGDAKSEVTFVSNNSSAINNNSIVEKNNAINTVTVKNSPQPPPDVHNFKSFPAITGTNTSNTSVTSSSNYNNNKVSGNVIVNDVSNNRTVSVKTSVAVVANSVATINSGGNNSNNTSGNSNNNYVSVSNNSTVANNIVNSNNKNNNNTGGGNKKMSPAPSSVVATGTKVKSKEYKSVGVLAQNCCVHQSNANSFVANINSGISNSGVSSVGGNNGGNVSSSSNNSNSDIQNDLSIIQANEKDSIQFNAQMLPPDIPDVQTIEKMHFMNRTPQNAPRSAPCTNTNVPLAEPNVPVVNTPVVIVNATPSPGNVVVGVAMAPASVAAVTNSIVHGGGASVPVANNNAPQHAYSNATPANVVSSGVNVNICDKNDDRTIMRTTEEVATCIEPEELPPVVILSGYGNDVSGLVFGFDINEQLLKDDICENFISKFVMPEVYNQQSHNHDKIVNFIGSAWESVICHSNAKVQYYSDDL